jgi:N-methylhydantoinase A/oxoprolinase/acetone carboxylase beta subunit
MRVVGIDTGGTFTDFILFDGREIRTHKVCRLPTTRRARSFRG